MSIDELERQVLGQTRASFERSSDDENAALSTLQKRLAAAPLAGLTGIELPPIPDVSGALVGAPNAAVVQGVTQAGAGAQSAALTNAGALQHAATAAQVASASQASAVATAATVTNTKLGIIALASQLTPVKVILAAALVGGGAGASLSVLSPPPVTTQKVSDDDLERTPTPSSAGATKAKSQQVSAALPSPPDDVVEEEPSKADPPQEQKRASDTQSPKRAVVPRPGSGSAAPTPRSAAIGNVPAVTSFNDELSYLRKAQSALREGDAQRAWQLMMTLDRERPAGALIPERRMTKVLALCALGRGEQAQSVARTVLSSSSGPMYRPRIEKSCASAVALPVATTEPSSDPSTASFPDRLK